MQLLPLLIMFIDHATATQLGVSRLEEMQLKICGFLHIYNCIFSELSTFFWTARGCVDTVSFHGPILSETVSASPSRCSPDTQSPFRDMYLGWVQSLWNGGRFVLMLARVRYPSESLPRGPISMTEHIRVIDYSRAPGE